MRAIKLLQQVQDVVQYYFIYTPEASEEWKSHADAVRSKTNFKDDCDGYAATCAELLLDYFSGSSIRLSYVKTETNEVHLVCLVDIYVNNRITDTYCLDNRRKRVINFKDTNYTFIKSVTMDNTGVWKRDGN